MFWDTIKRLYYLTILFFYFCYKIIESGWVVAVLILKGSRGDHGGMLEYVTSLPKSWQLVLLFNMISMTPGSLSVDILDDGRIIQVHLLRIADKDDFLAVTTKIESLLVKAL